MAVILLLESRCHDVIHCNGSQTFVNASVLNEDAAASCKPYMR